MGTINYVFADHAEEAEWRRLRAIEECFDPATCRRIAQLGVKPGWSCLEVGPGAGSVTRWLAGQVEAQGRVLALDIRPHSALRLVPANVEVRRQDIVTLSEHEMFDLIHTRYVLLHIQRWQEALTNMVRALKPGGWVLLEEPDFTTAAPLQREGNDAAAVMRVNEAVLRMYTAMGIDPSFGRRLPALCQDLGLENVAAEADLPVVPGGSGVARMMGVSLTHLTERLAATGAANQKDVEQYARLAGDPKVWGLYYTTIATWGQKPTTG
ncbi:class I SAM-dependent methyltransferase [Gloeobacter morelensis]|uniref:Methyltransferase domain-containing protein n=1 Tax=Gloeobacter morelensis MG652769 TaxID=2781736 RepID=A0ABY3PQ71_9CYAN|nr:methyltransferase domain-containing protein [Gloeobacter morelensis]UFP95852.1 methyltransferase domain-containing protein [Gloeobacter morelensis MG652769]